MKRLAVSFFVLCGAIGVFASPQGLLPVELSDLGYVRISGENVRVAISDAHASYNVGDQISLIEATPTLYVALAGDEANHQRLCVFPRRLQDGQGTAWITEQFELIFGGRARSVPGEISLRPTEILPIIFETETDYQVLCERHGKTFSLLILKNSQGITYYEDLPTSIVQRVRQREVTKQRLVSLEKWQNQGADLERLRLELLGDRPASHGNPSPGNEVSVSGSKPRLAPAEVGVEPKDPAVGLREYSHPFVKKLIVPKLSRVYPAQKREPRPAEPLAPTPQPLEIAQVAENAADPTPTTLPAPPEGPAELAAAVEVKPEPTRPPAEAPPLEPATHPTPEPAPEPAGASPEPVSEAPVAPEVTPAAEGSAIPGPVSEPAPMPEPEPAPEAAPIPTPEPIAIAQVDPPPPILETTILPSDAPRRKNVRETASGERTNSVAEAAVKLLIFMVVLTLAFLATILLLAKFMNRGPKAKRIQTKEEAAAATAPPPLPASSQPQAPAESPAPPPAPAVPDPPEPAATTEVKPPPSIRPVNDPSLGTFTGSLDGFRITELIQFIHSSQETGTLFISEPESPNHASVAFENGEAVHATCADQTGEPAMQDVLALQSGFFVFQRQPAVSMDRSITVSTMALLMSQSQVLDEEPVGAPAA